MPKENIDSSLRLNEGEPLRVEVCWSKQDAGGHVQIATVNPPATVSASSGATFSTVTSSGLTNGWFVDLDREGINRVIRSLRKARDQAFGRDE